MHVKRMEVKIKKEYTRGLAKKKKKKALKGVKGRREKVRLRTGQMRMQGALEVMADAAGLLLHVMLRMSVVVVKEMVCGPQLRLRLRAVRG